MNAKDLEPAKVSIINFFDEVKKEDNKKEQDNLNEGIFDQAIGYYERALKIDPSLVETQNNLGLSIMYGQSAVEKAIAIFKQVLKENPAHPQALNNLGISLCHMGFFEDGIKSYRQALAGNPGYTDAISNLASALRATGKINDAVELFQQAVELRPDYPEAHNNLAMMLLSVGRFDEGFHEYEWRWRTSQLKKAVRSFSQPQWKGEAISDHTVLIHAEQGFGDTLQFCRYADLIKEKGGHIIMEVPLPLVRIIKSMPSVERVIAQGAPLPSNFDFHCPMMSLPLALGTRIDTIPSNTPYLFPEPDDLAIWENLVPSSHEIKVGLVWAGNPRDHSFDLSSIDRQRSMSPENLVPLAGVNNVKFYSLQKDGTKAPPDFPVIDLMDQCHDFADTAALIMQLDLVISVDTSVVHLAGALGKPVWLLNRYDSCWRWMYNREDSEWYPNLRQFRQSRFGNWNDVMLRIHTELDRISSKARYNATVRTL